jgi:hypothetical protein
MSIVWPNFNQKAGFLENTKTLFFSSFQFIADSFLKIHNKTKNPQIQNRAKIILAALFVVFLLRKVKKGQKKSAKRVFYTFFLHFFLLCEKKRCPTKKTGGASSNPR